MSPEDRQQSRKIFEHLLTKESNGKCDLSKFTDGTYKDRDLESAFKGFILCYSMMAMFHRQGLMDQLL